MLMKRKLFDIAANLTDDQFHGRYHGKQYHQNDTEQVIERASKVGCNHLLIASGCLGDLKQAIKLCSKNHYTTAGVHPCRAREFNQQYWQELTKFRNEALQAKQLIAIGECGLDYDRLEWSTKEEQYLAFEPHFQWAQELNLPMYLHNRNTGNDFYEIVHANRHRFPGGVVHSFTGPIDELQKILALDLYVGINGCSLKQPNQLDVVKHIPLDKLLLETDSPYCEIRNTHASMKLVKTQFQAQKPEKWKVDQLIKARNEPCKIVQVLEAVAAILNIDEDILADQCFKNTLKCFNIVQ